MSDFSDSFVSSDPAVESGDPEPAPGLISSASAPTASQVSSAWADSTDMQNERETVGESAEPERGVTVVLSAVESRVLGSLIEKSYLTPDVYPMTTNGLATACNQKTNRDPVMDLSAVEIDAILLELRQRNLVRRVHSQGARSTKHRQTLDEALAVDDPQLVLLSVLLLRGPQTVNELRIRTERHRVGFDDLEAVVSCLESLASRATPLVRQLARQPGHKENRWQHLLADPDEEAEAAPAGRPQVAPSDPQASPAPMSAPATPASPGLEDRVVALETELATLRRQLASLAEQLGESLE